MTKKIIYTYSRIPAGIAFKFDWHIHDKQGLNLCRQPESALPELNYFRYSNVTVTAFRS